MKKNSDIETATAWFVEQSKATTARLLAALDADYQDNLKNVPRELVCAIHNRALHNVLTVVNATATANMTGDEGDNLDAYRTFLDTEIQKLAELQDTCAPCMTDTKQRKASTKATRRKRTLKDQASLLPLPDSKLESGDTDGNTDEIVP